MKQLVISGIFFAALIFLIVANSLYLDEMTSEMFEYIDALPVRVQKDDTETVLLLHALTDLWQDRRDVVALTVNYDYISSITLAINSTRELYEMGNESEYLSARYSLYESILRLHELEKPTLSNIL